MLQHIGLTHPGARSRDVRAFIHRAGVGTRTVAIVATRLGIISRRRSAGKGKAFRVGGLGDRYLILGVQNRFYVAPEQEALVKAACPYCAAAEPKLSEAQILAAISSIPSRPVAPPDPETAPSPSVYELVAAFHAHRR